MCVYCRKELIVKSSPFHAKEISSSPKVAHNKQSKVCAETNPA